MNPFHKEALLAIS